jgi:hypothetical protein
MEKDPISTGFLGFPWKYTHFLWFLPCFSLNDAILALFFLHERERSQAQNHAIPAQTARFDEGGANRQFLAGCLCGVFVRLVCVACLRGTPSAEPPAPAGRGCGVCALVAAALLADRL